MDRWIILQKNPKLLNHFSEYFSWAASWLKMLMVRSNADLLRYNPDSQFISHPKTKCKVLSLSANYVCVYVNPPPHMHTLILHWSRSVRMLPTLLFRVYSGRGGRYIWMERCKGYCSMVEHILSCRKFSFQPLHFQVRVGEENCLKFRRVGPCQ